MATRRTGSAPSEDDLERGLLMLAVCGGVCAEASRRLEMLEPPMKVAPVTLSRWRAKYRERYAEIQSERSGLIEGIVLQQVRDVIIAAGSLQAEALERLLAKIDELDAKELANVLKSAGVTLGINIEKMLLLTNRPTQITEKRDVNELLESLGKRVPGLIVDSSAEEIEDAREIGP